MTLAEREALDRAEAESGFVPPRQPSRGRALLAGAARRAVIALPYAWLALFFLAPFAIVAKLSFSTAAIAIPPYTPTLDWSAGPASWLAALRELTLDNYLWLTSDDLYLRAYLSSVKIAGIATAVTLLISYPVAYAMASAPRAWRPTLVMLAILPFWTSFLIRVYAWIGILKRDGFLNQLLERLELIDEPLTILYTQWAVYVGVVYSYMPFMVLPLYAALERMDRDLIAAAKDLGASPVTAFLTITLPLSAPGIVAGCLLNFIPAVGEFVIPDLLGGSDTLMIGRTLWLEFFNNRDWPLAAAVAIVAAGDPRDPHHDLPADPGGAEGGVTRLGPFGVVSLLLGFGFLYLPIVLLIVYSFNASQLVTVWAGFSTRWYGEVFRNEQLMDAAWVTIRVALISATLATALGVCAAMALVRHLRFRGRILFTGMVAAPLVMPEVITGLSLLLLFVAVGVDRGFWTVVIAHTTFSLCFVAVVVQSRLVAFDAALEEAAQDLGATPAVTFLTVTLPNIAPAVLAGWLLAFTLSLDDLVIASFASGPGATTLPMRIFSEVRLGVTPEINAVCSLLVAAVTVGVIAASLATKRREVRREREERAAQR